MDRGVVLLTAADVDGLLGTEEAIEAVEGAFRSWGLGEADPPGVLGVPVSSGGFHIKAAVLRRQRGYFAAKTNGNFPENPRLHHIPSIQGVIVLADAETGTPLSVMDSIRITELRTAAATAVAARHLARPDSGVATLVGCGAQAASQLRALTVVRPISKVRVLDADPDRAQDFAARMSKELGIAVERATDLRGAVGEGDICVTCTTSRRPFLSREMVAPGAFVAAVGADSEEKHEIDPELLGTSKVIVDSLTQCAAIGDLHHALDAGAMKREDVYAELGDVVAGRVEVRISDDEVIVFDSTGIALQDVACAALVFERAVEQGRGERVRLAPT